MLKGKCPGWQEVFSGRRILNYPDPRVLPDIRFNGALALVVDKGAGPVAKADEREGKQRRLALKILLCFQNAYTVCQACLAFKNFITVFPLAPYCLCARYDWYTYRQ